MEILWCFSLHHTSNLQPGWPACRLLDKNWLHTNFTVGHTKISIHLYLAPSRNDIVSQLLPNQIIKKNQVFHEWPEAISRKQEPLPLPWGCASSGFCVMSWVPPAARHGVSVPSDVASSGGFADTSGLNWNFRAKFSSDTWVWEKFGSKSRQEVKDAFGNT